MSVYRVEANSLEEHSPRDSVTPSRGTERGILVGVVVRSQLRSPSKTSPFRPDRDGVGTRPRSPRRAGGRLGTLRAFGHIACLQGDRGDIVRAMKTISVAVSEADYEAFQQAARDQGRSAAQLIRDAMGFFRREKLERRNRLIDVPVLTGPRLVAGLPTRHELYDELFEDRFEADSGAPAESPR